MSEDNTRENSINKEVEEPVTLEDKYRILKEKYANVFENASDCIILCDPVSRRFVDTNEIAAMRLGYSKEELLTLRIDDIDPSFATVRFKNIINEIKSSGVVVYETEHINKEGVILPVEVKSKLVALDGRKLVQSFIRDISSRKAAEKAVRENNRTYRSLVENMVDVIWQMDMDFGFTYVNPAVFCTLGYTQKEWLNTSLKDHMNSKEYNRIKYILQNELVKKISFSKVIETFVYHKNGNKISVEFTCLMLGEDESAEGFQGIIRNISERKKAEAALKDAKYKAEEANRAKSNFLANMSHELRTPLNSINGFSEMMTLEMLGKLPEVYKKYSHNIHSSGQHLLLIINDILDMSKVEAGKLELSETETNVSELINEALAMLHDKIEENNVCIVMDYEKENVIRVDPLRIKQVIINILSNAIKFSPDGTVKVSVDFKGHMPKIVVSDTGIGMSENDIVIAFAAFGQVEADAHTRSVEGTGLGLALSRKLMRLHGGDLDVESKLGVGTTVTMLFPSSPVGDRLDIEFID